MAYDFFPKTSKQIMDKLGGKFPAENVAELIILHERLSKEYGLETPINIDTAKKSNINVSRALEGDTTIPKIVKLASMKHSYRLDMYLTCLLIQCVSLMILNPRNY